MNGLRLRKRFQTHRLGVFCLGIVLLFGIVGLFAPFFASNKPLMVWYNGTLYFPLFRYLLYHGFYTKWLDIFFNVLALLVPFWLLLGRFVVLPACLLLLLFPVKDPAFQPSTASTLDWQAEWNQSSAYTRLNLLLNRVRNQRQNEHLLRYAPDYARVSVKRWLTQAVQRKKSDLLRSGVSPDQLPPQSQLEEKVLQETAPEVIEEITALPTLWNQERLFVLERLKWGDQEEQTYWLEREQFLQSEVEKVGFALWPLLSHFHWEEDAGGNELLNQQVAWWDLTRINRKDLIAALIFGVRISLTVGILAVSLALLIGVPIGAFAGYFGGKWDITVSRLLEIWEAMPTFFMLLMIVAITQSKTIFLVIAVIGFFGWTSFSRYIRAEFFKQRNLPYVEACHSMGFSNRYIMFHHLLPNAIPPVLTLLPFSIMGA
ncbi:MAG: ABC transporter permease, partial [Chlamydiia bacterium]|nr:ABC transporter permease [Chlamydiia bacterium]